MKNQRWVIQVSTRAVAVEIEKFFFRSFRIVLARKKMHEFVVAWCTTNTVPYMSQIWHTPFLPRVLFSSTTKGISCRFTGLLSQNMEFFIPRKKHLYNFKKVLRIKPFLTDLKQWGSKLIINMYAGTKVMLGKWFYGVFNNSQSKKLALDACVLFVTFTVTLYFSVI